MKYTKTFRDSILRKVLPPENRSVSSVSKEMGVAVVTINSWLAKLKNGTLSLEEDGGAGCRNANEKLNLLLAGVVGFELLVRFYFFFWLLFISKIFVWELIR